MSTVALPLCFGVMEVAAGVLHPRGHGGAQGRWLFLEVGQGGGQPIQQIQQVLVGRVQGFRKGQGGGVHGPRLSQKGNAPMVAETRPLLCPLNISSFF
jgi:hypothetical protein